MKKILSKFRFEKISLFPRIFLSMLLMILLPIIVISAINYNLSRKNLEKEVNESNLDTLRQTKLAVDNVLEATERIGLQIARNDRVNEFLNKNLQIEAFNDVKLIKEVMNVCGSLTEAAPYIRKISVFSIPSNARISSDNCSLNVMTAEEIEKLKEISKKQYTVFGVESFIKQDTNDNNDSMRLLKFIYGANEVKGFIQIHIRNDEFAKLIKQIYIRKSGYIVALDETGSVIINGQKGIGVTQNLEFSLKLLDSFEGYKTAKIKGSNMLIAYTTSSYNAWKYISVLAAEELHTTAYLVTNTIMVVCGIFAVIALFLSLLMSSGIYKPIAMINKVLSGEKTEEKNIEKLNRRKDEIGQINRGIYNIVSQLSNEKQLNDNILREYNELKGQVVDNVFNMKKHFFYRLICGDITDSQEITSQATSLGIPTNGVYVVAILNIEKRFSEEIGSLEKEERILIKRSLFFNFEKTIVEVAASIKIFQESRDKIIAIIGFYDSECNEESMKKLKYLCKAYQNLIFEQYHRSVAIAIGNGYRGIEEIRKSYDEAVGTLKLRFILGKDAVLLRGEIKETQQHLQEYYKKYVLNYLETRKTSELNRVLNQYETSLKENISYNMAYTYYCRDIINTIITFLNKNQVNDITLLDEISEVLFKFESKFEAIDELIEWIYIFCVKVFDKINNRAGETSYSKVVAATIRIIEQNYDKDLSLAEVAEELSVSFPHLSKVFKDEVGKNFKEFLTEVKIEKAKELLKNTNQSIQEIANKVGYNNYKQFGRMFQKLEGVSPNEYRSIN